MRSTAVTHAFALVGALFVSAVPRLAHADPALEWNLHGVTAAVAAKQAPTVSSRTKALMHVALFPTFI